MIGARLTAQMERTLFKTFISITSRAAKPRQWKVSLKPGLGRPCIETELAATEKSATDGN